LQALEYEVIWLIGVYYFATSIALYSFEGLVEDSTVVVFADYRGGEEATMRVFNVVAGVLEDPGSDLIQIRIPDDKYYSNPRPGRSLYFVRQCNGVSEIAGNGQGAFGVVGGKFMIQFDPGEMARLAGQAEIAELISKSGRLAASVICPAS
jgi:hypothetical protein